MTEILLQALALLAVVAGLVALVGYARHDRFAGPGTGDRRFDKHSDELGTLAFRRRPI